MTTTQALEILIIYNKWRRGSEIPQPDPKEIGMAIDVAIAELNKLVK